MASAVIRLIWCGRCSMHQKDCKHAAELRSPKKRRYIVYE